MHLPVQRIGLTGGIGSGKSTVARVLVACGAALIDADAISRQLTAPGGVAIGELAKQFGPQVITAEGAMDRERMRRLAFNDPAIKGQLEAIKIMGTSAVQPNQAPSAANNLKSP